MFAPEADFFERIPTTAGVYLMKSGDGTIIYVGKAKNLRTRVRQYFRDGGDARFFVASGLLARALADIETVVVDNEKEALLLENHLIKKHQPRFNVNLRDDKQYLVLRIDPRVDFPRVEVVRNIKDDGARYFGPYHSATSCRETLRTLNRHFQLRTCTDHVLKTRTRPCLQYQIKRCPGPCVFPIEPSSYADQVDDVIMFLSGKNDQLVARLRTRMRARSRAEEYELAAQLRDSIAAVERSLAKQHVVQDQFVDQDVFGMWREDETVELVVLFIRGGKLVGRRSLRQSEQEFSDAEVMSNFVQQYYAAGSPVPNEVIVPMAVRASDTLIDWLSGLAGRKVRLIVPQRGTRVRLLELAAKNAASQATTRAEAQRDARASLEKLQRRLSLRRVPVRIECYDIAHIQGTSTVASMVVFIDGKADKALYRKFRLRTVTNNDFAAMYEVLTRRFQRMISEPDSSWRRPDLVVIDGGKGQLGSAVAALRDLGVEQSGDDVIDVVALAKEREDQVGNSQPDRVYRRGIKDPIPLRANTTELFLLARVRDEAHRFANTYHRNRRTKSSLRSALDDVPGIGKERRKRLLRHFGSVEAIRSATEEAIANVDGMTRGVARRVVEHLSRHGD